MAGRRMAEQEGVPIPVPWHLSWSGGLPTIVVGEKVSPMSNIERNSASGKQGPPQSSIEVHGTRPVLHPQRQHAQEEAQCSTSPEIPRN
ncbi:unnamed protein product [Sphagnum jensenii]|uniref:Uncharacterized protein n=1 Tax=Sphagnum jensenii TaxID=128206 RepID=A0ABP1AXK4_9BRYO